MTAPLRFDPAPPAPLRFEPGEPDLAGAYTVRQWAFGQGGNKALLCMAECLTCRETVTVWTDSARVATAKSVSRLRAHLATHGGSHD
jgi:hypothetical protein